MILEMTMKEAAAAGQLSRMVSKIGLARKLQKQYGSAYIVDVKDSTGKRVGYAVPVGKNPHSKLKVGDKVRSKEHGTVGYLHHIGDRGKAWVSDDREGDSGQFFYLEDLIPYERENPKKSKRRRNPEVDAEAAFDSFHGEPSKETVVIESEVHEHEHLFTCGRLMELCVATLTGKYLALNWLEAEDADVPYLACSENGRQLFIEGGDQEIDLKAIDMESDRWVKDRMVIGQFAEPEPKRKYNITYRTRKRFDDFEEIDYQHDLGESSKELRNPARPFLEYEPQNKRLYITGGQYLIKLPKIGVSAGIEN